MEKQPACSLPTYLATSASKSAIWNGLARKSLASPEMLAASIIEDLQMALEQFTAIAEDLGEGTAMGGK